MKFFSAAKYYIFSLPKIIFGMNFWILPFIFIKKPQLLKLTGGYKFQIGSLLDAWTVKEVMLDDCYMSRWKRYGDIINVGSGIGDFDVMMSKTSHRIFSFDASEDRKILMQKNLQLNNVSNVIFEKKTVESLNEIFENNHIEQCDLLKIDCEGAEYEIFKNTSDKNILKLKQIVGEIHLFNDNMKNDYAVVKSRLYKLGFEIYETPNPVHENIIFFEVHKK